MTRWYWQQVGGLLIEEFPLVRVTSTNAPRYLDGLIVLGEATRVASKRTFEITGRDVIAVQAKARRLGMPVMGQCLFSRDLLMAMNPATIRSIALCTQDESTLRPLLEAHGGCEVVIYKP